MIKQLRKRHLQIWTAWAVLLPVGIIAAYTSVKKPVAEKLLQPNSANALAIELKKMDKENYSVALRSSADTSQLQLEWVNKNMLTVPTATIYQVAAGNDIATGKLIGRIEARGTYYFPVDTGFLKNINRLIVYDFIHQQIIDTIKL
jgi:hypothetical protein